MFDFIRVFLSVTQFLLCLAMVFVLLTNGPGGDPRA